MNAGTNGVAPWEIAAWQWLKFASLFGDPLSKFLASPGLLQQFCRHCHPGIHHLVTHQHVLIQSKTRSTGA